MIVIRNLFRLKKELKSLQLKDIRNLFRQEKETKAIKYGILRDKINKIRSYFKDILNILKNSDTWKI